MKFNILCLQCGHTSTIIGHATSWRCPVDSAHLVRVTEK